ncbi:hypothetical protein KW785_01460 [Candidatus Parcubacteria bacterium]|nr:hypothetical protein [Candidatus Parcubacteria bacterium]
MDILIKDMGNKGLNAKKTEKLVTAIYLLTSFFEDKEPMKWRLRELGSKLLSQRENHTVVQEIMSLMSVAKHSGLITDMNFEIIHREFSRLLPEPISLENLLVSDTSVAYQEPPREKPSLYVASSLPTPTYPREPEVKDKLPERASEEKKTLKEFGAVAVKKNSRQSVIISLLKRKKEIMIKDVSPLIDGVSEKTIQRELLAMVQAGILKKAGEKRWSRYSLAE